MRILRNCVFISILFAIYLIITAPVFSEAFYIIANNDVPEDSISEQRLQDIFLGDIGNWPNGDRIVLAILRSGDANRAFLSRIIGRTAAQYNTYWKQIVFTGRGTAPNEFNSDSDIINFVSNNRGAIGFTASEPPDDDRVKVITID